MTASPAASAPRRRRRVSRRTARSSKCAAAAGIAKPVRLALVAPAEHPAQYAADRGAGDSGRDRAAQVEEGDPGSGDSLQDEAFAGEQPGAEALLPGDFERHRFLGAQERLLAADQGLASGKRHGEDLARESRCESDLAGLLGGEIG